MSGSAGDSVRAVRDFPHAIRTNTDLKIPLADGRVLSARLWLPETAASMPVPAIVEYDPYRHRDVSYPRDTLIHPWFAGHGFASIRLQPAGAGNSTGLPMDEYVKQEQDDCMEALAWIASQPWCSGKTGLFGMSWGANAALQVATRRPPSLKAIIPVHGTDNRYTDDIHYKGGCLLTAGLAWGSTYHLYAMRPPDPTTFGPGWRDEWMNRLTAASNVLKTWLSHQSRDEYWQHGSVSEDYSSIEAATLIVSGGSDDYRNAAIRMAAHLTCPHDLLVGPWGHEYPHLAGMKPRAGFLQIATGWWNRWLRDETEITATGRACIFMEDPAPAVTRGTLRPGRWLTLPQTDFSGLPKKLFHLSDTPETITVCTPLSAAIEADQWLSQGRGDDSPVGQTDLETGAHVFTLLPLEETLDVLGQPLVSLTVQTDTPCGHIITRLSTVAPDGDIQPLSMGVLNLRFRNGFETPHDMSPRHWVTVRVPLDSLTRRIPAGFRLRLSVATQAWPLIWPEPVETNLQIQAASAALSVPCLPPGVAVEEENPPEEAAVPVASPVTQLRKAHQERTISQDPMSGRITRTQIKDHGSFRVEENGVRAGSTETQSFSALGKDPLSARAVLSNQVELSTADCAIRLENEVIVIAGPTSYILSETVYAYENEKLVYSDETEYTVPRA